MKFTTIPVLALVGLVAATDKSACAAKNTDLMGAINAFCANDNIVVPSSTSQSGKTGADGHTKIWIHGTCNPAEWVPSKYCYSQFYNMCATGGAHGGKIQYYGSGGCQKWVIQYTANLVFAGPLHS